MRDPKQEFLRFHYGDDAVQSNFSNLNDLEIIRNDIDRIDKNLSEVKSQLQELVLELRKLNTL
tara:strand:- start:1217 stop:1405 length:189 start_codon:yes stop_codon:yes gene_type:complete